MGIKGKYLQEVTAQDIVDFEEKDLKEIAKEQKLKARQRMLKKKPFGGKVGFRGSGIGVSASQGTKTIKGLFGYK